MDPVSPHPATLATLAVKLAKAELNASETELLRWLLTGESPVDTPSVTSMPPAGAWLYVLALVAERRTP